MSMTLNFLGGAPFELLYDGVKLAISNTRKFNIHLRSLKFTLDCLQPQIIEQIRLQNLQLNIPNQEIQELQRKIDEGIVLVGKLSRLNSCNIRIWGSCCSCLMVSYADQLDDLNESLRRLLEILRLQSLAQVNQIGILARITRDRQDELGRRQLEILSNQRHIIDTLTKQQQIIERIEKNGVAASTGKEGPAPVQVLRLGAVFQALFEAVVQVKVKNSRFKQFLEDFKFTLDCLKPLVQEITECNKVLHFPKEDILEDFIAYLEKGVDLVYKCSKSSRWNRFKKYEYINSLFELDESLQRLFNILRLQIENDVNDALVSVSKLEKEIKEIEESLALQHNQYESAAADLQLPKVDSDVTKVQETRDVKQSMDSTGNVEVGDGSRKQTEGSSLAIQRVDVAQSPTIKLDVIRLPERVDSARYNMEVGLEETGQKGKNERELRLVQKELLTPVVPVLPSQTRQASSITDLERHDKKYTTTLIQTVLKGKTAEVKYVENYAATLIQRSFRRYLACKSAYAVVLQSVMLTDDIIKKSASTGSLSSMKIQVPEDFLSDEPAYASSFSTKPQETRDVKQSIDSTGNVEVGDGSRKQIEGSGLAVQRVDVAQSPTIKLDVISLPEIVDSARHNMEVGLEETGQKGKNGAFGMTHRQALAQVTAQASQSQAYTFHIPNEHSTSMTQLPVFSSSTTPPQEMPSGVPDSGVSMKESSDMSHSERSQPSSLTVDKPNNDGYNWRKYGQKQVKGSEFPRSYYKCTHPSCPVKKKVERSVDGQITEIIYKGEHNHQRPQSKRPKDNQNGNVQVNHDLTSQVHAKEGTSSMSKQGQESSQAISGTSDSEEVGDAETKVEDKDDDEPDAKRRYMEVRHSEPASSHRTVTDPRIIVQTTSEVDVLDDGYRWRKYGQKVVKDSPYPRNYYKCTFQGCSVRKHVERAATDPKAVITTYEGKHNNDVPASKSGSYAAHNRASNQGSGNQGTQKHASVSRMDPRNNDQQPVARLRLKEAQIT